MDATFEEYPQRTARAAAPALAIPVALVGAMLACQAVPAHALTSFPSVPGPAAPLLLVQKSGSVLTVANISATPGEKVPLGIGVALDDQSQAGLVMIRGVPKQLSLSSGFRSGETWMVSVKDVPALTLDVPDGFGGTFEIEVTLVLGKESRERRIAAVSIAAADRQPTSAKIENEPAPRPPVTASIAPEEERAMIERAVDLLRNGDVSSARLLYQHLANSGSAVAALSLARTFDPEVLPSLGVIGMRPNPAEAQRWYKRAAELGSESAARRLRASASDR
jgi:hypothetical protein